MPSPTPSRTQITLRLPEDVRQQAAILAAVAGQRLQQWAEEAVREKIERDRAHHLDDWRYGEQR